MRVLLDTHAFLWYVLDDPRLSVKARQTIDDPQNEVAISPASYWEIAIKIGLGKYVLSEPYDVFMDREISANDFRILPIETRHTMVLTTLPLHHRDPFDRLIIAQAIHEAIPLVSADACFDAYPIQRLW